MVLTLFGELQKLEAQLKNKKELFGTFIFCVNGLRRLYAILVRAESRPGERKH